ncbi:MAG: hypothetical protein LBV57_06070 [Candidatus Symbiothrix sp.]|jgi:hypothetical protein|nr:hypothetical protein [Candidatus Symbiothrix sp.]
MKNVEEEFHVQFVATIREKLPERGRVANALIDLLCVEKEGVYRRLRGEVPFTFSEIMKISNYYNISLDNLIGIVSPYRSKSLHLHIQNYFDMSEVDYKMSRDYITAIQQASGSPYAEFGFATNILPLHASVLHPPLFRFYMLKWMYQFGDSKSVLPYSAIHISPELREFHDQYIASSRLIKYTYIIWDEFFLLHLISDIQYFHSIRLLTEAEVALLKSEIEHLLQNIEKLSIRCSFPNGNKIDMFISNIHLETSYSYLSTDKMYISMIDAFTLGAVTSLESSVCDQMKTWMHSLKRTATLISGTEKPRIDFFERQWKWVEKL